MDNNFNIDENTMNKLNSMMKNGDVSKLLSQIPPEMLENFSSLMNNSNASNANNTNNTSNSTNNTNSFDLNNLDMNTILKMKSVIEKMNTTNDPRSNLLASLKPYLRDTKKEKLEQYANLINFAKIAEILKNDNKEPK